MNHGAHSGLTTAGTEDENITTEVTEGTEDENITTEVTVGTEDVLILKGG
jgi:hypothetical protein